MIDKIISNPQIVLKNVEYKWLPVSVNEEKLKVSAKDEFNYEFDKSNNLIVTIQRSVFIDPPQLFSIDIIFNVVWEIQDDHIEELNQALEKLSDEDKNYMCFTAKNECALLIAQLTKAGNLPPLWTPSDLLL
ncbi:MAG: hypothetical protein IJ571_05765 [Ruminococcus sp.]|nr:hypothetical protein [Ruminococcus sp.]